MKLSSIIFCSVLAGTSFVACRKADPVQPKLQNEVSDIYGTFDGLGAQRIFEPRFSNDTIYFDVPYFYPVTSDNETDLKKIILRSTIPLDAKASPSLGEVMDLTNPVAWTVTSGSGVQRNYVLVAKKIGDLSLGKATVTFTDGNGAEQVIEGVMQPNNEVLFYVFPGTVMNNTTLTYEINRHSSGSVANGGSIDLAGAVPFTVTSIDGSTRTYTLRATEPVKLDYGFGINRRLFTRSGAELNFTSNMETGLAVSGDHLVVAARTNPGKFSVYNRFTGDYVQQMFNPYPTGLLFQVTDDQNGHLLTANFGTMNTALKLYKFDDPFDTNPELLVNWTVTDLAGYGSGERALGRRVNIYGNLEGDAVIMLTASQTNAIYKWEVKAGQLVSNTPIAVRYADAGNMGYVPEAQPISTDINGKYFVNYQSEIALVNGTTNTRAAKFTPLNGAVFHNAMSYAGFNNTKYLAIVKFIWTYSLNRVQLSLFDVTSESKITLPLTSAEYSSFNVYNSEDFYAPTNANGTSDIAIGFSHGGDRMQVYLMLTNGGIMAHEFTNYKP